MAIASGRIQIIDYNDALTLNGYINTNHIKNQTYDPDNNTYTPDWKKENLVLSPVLNKIGSTENIITSPNVRAVKWYLNGSSTAIVSGGNYVLSGEKSHILTINDNVMTSTDKVYLICQITYFDIITTLEMEHKLEIEFSKYSNGSGSINVSAWAPQGNIFKEDVVDTLVAECNLSKDGVNISSGVTYQWYYEDKTSEEDQGAGEGWVKIDALTHEQLTGYNTNKLQIGSGAVEGTQRFKCMVGYTAKATGDYFDVIEFINNEEPIKISILSTGGNIFKNNVGSSTLTARLFKKNKEVDTEGELYNYTWKKYDNDNILDGSFTKTGKTITVNSNNVNLSANFVVEIEKKSDTKSLKRMI